MVYQSKISSTMIVNHRTGDTEIEEMEVNVDGYKKKLKDKKKAYNPKETNQDEYWPKGMCCSMFEEHYKALKNLEITIKRNRKNN